MFSMTLAQLAWERDIDLTKGKTFVTDPNLIEKLSPYIKKEELTKSPVIPNHQSPNNNDSPTPNHIPNGVKHRGPGERTVKKPAGTPKAATNKQFSYNRVSPLTITKQPSPAEESGSDLEGSKPSRSISKNMSVTDISLHGLDSTKSGYRKMFLEESRQNKEVKKIPLDDVPNVTFKPGYATSKSSSVKSDSSKSKSDSEYKPSFGPKSEDGYTSHGSVESSKASRISKGSVSSKSSKHSQRTSTSTVDETVTSSASMSSKPRADCTLQEIDSETEDTSRISKISSSQRETEHETSESSAKPPRSSRTVEEEGSPKKHKHKRKKSKKSRHSSRASSATSLIRSEEDGESQV